MYAENTLGTDSNHQWVSAWPHGCSAFHIVRSDTRGKDDIRRVRRPLFFFWEGGEQKKSSPRKSRLSGGFVFFSFPRRFFFFHMQSITGPACPKCGSQCVQRIVKKEGPHKGRMFWACPKSQDQCNYTLWPAPTANAVHSAPTAFPMSPYGLQSNDAPMQMQTALASSSSAAPTNAELAAQVKQLAERIAAVEQRLAQSRVPTVSGFGFAQQ